MKRSPFQVSTIEEDFKRIGLSSDEEALTEGYKKIRGGKEASITRKTAKIVKPDNAETGKPLGRAGKPGEAPKADDTETDESADSDEDGEPVVEAEPPAAADAELAERIKIVRKKRAGAKLKKLRRKQKVLRRHSRSKLRQKAKRWRRSARGKRFLKKYAVALHRFGHVPQGRRISLKQGMDRVSNLIEEVNAISKATDDADFSHESVKSFANLALIANDLAEGFSDACKASKEAAEESKKAGEPEDKSQIDFCEAAEELEAVAERSADLSEALNVALQEGATPSIGSDELKAEFAEAMETVMAGLDLFADLSEAAEGEARP